MITLYQYPPAMGLPNASPFCMKIETWLRMAELDYQVELMPDPRKTPYGKLPMIDHDGHKVPDSGCIIPYLEQACGVNLDASLSLEQKAIGHAYTRMLEEHSYWGLVYGRWLDDNTWPQVREVWFGKMPPGVKQLLSRYLRKLVRRDAHGQGLSRHPQEEVMRRLGLDMEAVSQQLGDKDYFLASEPHNVDATIFAFLSNIARADLDDSLKPLVNAHANLVAYCDRMQARYFGNKSQVV
ncbi:MAG: glutathione S-transferase family protein [Salinisphaeraceae bacterium]|nr:glutathione S-transferase family protein [Salinisphaeraceae bacterium]